MYLSSALLTRTNDYRNKKKVKLRRLFKEINSDKTSPKAAFFNALL
jgi:hypothetical protein